MSAAARYELGEPLGSGGVATVWLARDRQSGAKVAVKRLAPQLASDAAMARRFSAEARALAALDHPGVLRLIDAGQDGDGSYLVTEYVDGPTLRERIDAKGPLPPEELRRVTLALCDALDHAHGRGVIHRDVKPANVLLGADGRVVLADFGSARVQALASLTGSSLLWGSPEYMAPEAFAGGRVDPRTDLFSLGVVIVEMAHGRLPWPAGAPLARLASNVVADFAPLGLGADFDALVHSLLDPIPSRRPASAREVATALQQAPGSTALAITRAVCPSCGAGKPADLPVCLACGRHELDVRHVVDGDHEVVLKKLEERASVQQEFFDRLGNLAGLPGLNIKFLTGDIRLYSKEEQETGSKLPATLFSDLDEAGAKAVARALESTGVALGVNKQRRPSARAPIVGAAIGLGIGAVLVGMIQWLAPGFGHALSIIVPLGVAAVGAALGHSRNRVATHGLKSPLRLAERPMAPPAANRLLEAVRTEAALRRSPEVRALLEDAGVEVFRLTQRAAAWSAEGASAAAETALAHRMLDAAPRLFEGLSTAARRLDDLDAALAAESEGELAQSLARIERKLVAPRSSAETAEWQATRQALLEALDRRAAAEEERDRLAALLCSQLAHLRDALRGAREMNSPQEREAQALEAAARELDAYLGSDRTAG